MRRMALSLLVSSLFCMPFGACGQPVLPDGVKITDGILTDARGMTLYTYDSDMPGKSTCYGACIGSWPALPAPTDAKSAGDWAPVTRDDGTKQWAYKGKPLYTFVPDAKPGDTSGDNLSLVWHTARP